METTNKNRINNSPTKKACKLAGQYDDVLCMAYFL